MTVQLRELREDQARLVTQARAKLDEITDDTPQERAQEIEHEYDRIMAEYDRLQGRIEREEQLAARQARLEEIDTRRRPVPEDRTEEGERPNGEIRLEDVFTRAMRFGAGALDTAEQRALLNLRAAATPEMRAQGTTTAAGGYTIPQGFLAELELAQAAWGPMLDPGITRVINTTTGNRLPWPTADDTANEGVLVEENTPVGEQDVVFGEAQLDAYLYSSKIVRVSLQLLQDSAFNIESLLRELFGERIGRIANRHLTVGDGVNKPHGVVTASSEGHQAVVASAIASDELYDLVHAIDPAYRSSPNFRWMYNDRTFKVLRKMKDGDGSYLWQMGDVRGGAPATLLQYPYTINQAMANIESAARPIIIGDFNTYIVRRVRDFTMLRLDERYADFLQVGFLSFNRIDGELTQPAAVKHMVMA